MSRLVRVWVALTVACTPVEMIVPEPDAGAAVDAGSVPADMDGGMAIQDAGVEAPLDGGRDVDPPDAGEPPPPPPPCPDGVVCADDFPFTHRATTLGAASNHLDAYGCAPDVDESGPEVVYRVELTEAGFLALDLPRSAM